MNSQLNSDFTNNYRDFSNKSSKSRNYLHPDLKKSNSRSNSNSRKNSRSRSRSKNRSRSTKKIKRKSKWSNAPDDYADKLKSIITLPQLSTNQLIQLTENTKFQRKVYIPKLPGVNFVGLLIGPKGTYQKRLEAQTNCKILIRGKNTHKEGSMGSLQSQTENNIQSHPEDEDKQHVLVIGDNEESVIKAQLLVERVLNSDNETRNKIKEEQLKAAQELTSEVTEVIEDHLMTPYGPPDKNARILPVPNDCVGLIIGKNGETIRKLHRDTGCKIQIAKKEIPNTDVRNVFIEGPSDKYKFAKQMIEDIVAEQQKMKLVISNVGEINPFPGPFTKFKIQDKFTGLIIGKNGENIRNLHKSTGSFIFIPKQIIECGYRMLEISGTQEGVTKCIKQIENLLSSVMAVSKAQPELNISYSYDPNYLNAHNQYMQQQYGINMMANTQKNLNCSIDENKEKTSNFNNLNFIDNNYCNNVGISNNNKVCNLLTNSIGNACVNKINHPTHISNNNNFIPVPLPSIAMNNNLNLPINGITFKNQLPNYQVNPMYFKVNSLLQYSPPQNYLPYMNTMMNNIAMNLKIMSNLSQNNNVSNLNPMININNYYNNTNQINNYMNSNLNSKSNNISDNSKLPIPSDKNEKFSNRKSTNSSANSGGILNYIYGGQV